MNIAIANEFFPPYITGGTEIFLENLAQYLNSEGFKVIVITTEQGQKENSDFKVYKLTSSPFHFSYRYQFHGITVPWMFFNSRLKKEVASIYNKEKIDLLHANNMFHLSFAPIQTNIPFVLDIHDYWPVCFSKDLYYCDREHCTGAGIFKCPYCISGKMRASYLAPFMAPGLAIESGLRERLLAKAKKTICHSQFVSGKLGKCRADVIPYPFFGECGAHAKRQDKELRLLFAGRLDKKKGAHLLPDIARELKEQGMLFRIDVLGEGPLKTELDRADLCIYTHGFLGKERFEFFKNADILLALSVWPEPFGIVALEAMAYNVPIIAIDGSGLAQLVQENKAGIVCGKNKVAESIIRLSGDEKRRRSIMKNEAENISKYDKKNIFGRYKKMFENLI